MAAVDFIRSVEAPALTPMTPEQERADWIVYDSDRLHDPDSGSVIDVKKQPDQASLMEIMKGKKTGERIPGRFLPESAVFQEHSEVHARFWEFASAMSQVQDPVIEIDRQFYSCFAPGIGGEIILIRCGVADSGDAKNYRVLSPKDRYFPAWKIHKKESTKIAQEKIAPSGAFFDRLDQDNSPSESLYREVLPQWDRFFIRGRKFSEVVHQRQENCSYTHSYSKGEHSIKVALEGEKRVYRRGKAVLEIFEPHERVAGRPTTEEIIDFLGMLPEDIVEGLECIHLVDRSDFGIFAFYFKRCPENGWKNRVTFQRGNYDWKAALLHELGHLFALRTFGYPDPARLGKFANARWIQAMIGDNYNVTKYSRSKRAEDFAETFALYFMTAGGRVGPWRYHLPHRFEVLDDYLGHCFWPSTDAKEILRGLDFAPLPLQAAFLLWNPPDFIRRMPGLRSIQNFFSRLTGFGDASV